MAESMIVGPDGKPIRKQELTKEIARASLTGVRNVWSFGSVASGLDPERLASILRSAAEGDHNAYITLAEEMEERDPHYSSVLGTRKRAVSGLDPMVESATDEQADIKIADAVREMTLRPQFGEMVDDLLDAIGKGFAVDEIMWDRSGREWWPERYEWRDQRFFRFDRVTGRQLRLLSDENTFEGEPLEQFKFIAHVPRLKAGLPIRNGVARLVATAYMCKAFAITDWMAFAEIFGMPLRVGRYGPNATKDDIQTLINAVANIGSDAAAVLPDGMKIEFEKNGTSSGGEKLFEGLATYLDKQVSKAVLGQTMTSDDGSSKSQAEVHDEVRGDIKLADIKQLQNTINAQLVKPFVDLNFGVQKRYPRVLFPVHEAEDIKALSEAINLLVPIGLEVEESFMRDKLGIPDPAKGAKLLRPATQVPAPTEPAANHQHCSHCDLHKAKNREQDDYDFFDELADDALSDWEEQVEKAVVSPLEQLLAESKSYEDFVAGLPAVLAEMETGDVVQRLAAATFKARGLGDATDDVSGE